VREDVDQREQAERHAQQPGEDILSHGDLGGRKRERMRTGFGLSAMMIRSAASRRVRIPLRSAQNCDA
jgi:hypothetical protein